MFKNQTATQSARATGPLPGRGIAPVVGTFRGRCRAAHLSPFVTSDLRFDIAAIRADAKARYALKLDFINSYTGAARRFWQWRQARQAIRTAWTEANRQHHEIVVARLPDALPYTRQERARLAELRGIVIGAAPASRIGMTEFKAASGEYKAIEAGARQRAYAAIIAQARRAS